MRDSDSHDRTPLNDDFIAVSPEDCVKAYLEFPSEADLAATDERREVDGADGVAAFTGEADEARSRAGVDTSERMESTLADLSSSVPEAKQPTLAWRVDPPNRRVQRVVVAIATVGALAAGVLGGRVLLGPRVVGPAMRVGADPSPAPTPQTAVVETQAEPAASTIPTPETITDDRQLDIEAPQPATPTVALAASNGTSNSPRAVQRTLSTPSMTASAVEAGPPAVSLPNPPPAAAPANSVADLGVGDSAPVARANPSASVTPETIVASLPAPASPVGTSGAAVANATMSTPIVNTTGEVNRVLVRYQAAFSGLDVEAVRQIWPTANGKALSKAFEQLEEERLTFESCDVRMSGITAAAICSGTMRYVPRVGNKSARVERNQWHLSLREAADGWVVDSVDVRPRR